MDTFVRSLDWGSAPGSGQTIGAPISPPMATFIAKFLCPQTGSRHQRLQSFAGKASMSPWTSESFARKVDLDITASHSFASKADLDITASHSFASKADLDTMASSSFPSKADLDIAAS